MGDMGEGWSEHRQERAKKRADNRETSARLLTEAGLSFDSHNEGAHLVVQGNGELVDFWPGTGLWKVRRSGQQSRGVARLIKKLVGEPHP